MNTGRDSKTILIPFQTAAILAIASFLVYSCIDLHLRNRRSWQTIVARLSPAWNDEPSYPIAPSASSLFRDAGVMMEMADYAERHTLDGRRDALAALREGALQLRLASLRALLRNGLHST